MCNRHVDIYEYNVCGLVHVCFNKLYLTSKECSLPDKNEVIQCKSQDQIHEYNNAMGRKGATVLLSSILRL